MFNHDGRLPHLLSPSDYFSDEQYQRELKSIFRSSWFCVGSIDELRNDGDFLTLDLLDKPVLVRREGGEIRAFLNVCAHRHSLLVPRAAGNSRRIQCRYHGWEYDAEGRVCKVPEATCFVPVKKGEYALVRYRTAVRGRLVFVCLDEGAPSLLEFLGPATLEYLDANYGDQVEKAAGWDVRFDCNWKVLVENTIESYHIPIVHPKTLGGNYPPPKQLTHAVDEFGVTYRDDNPALQTLGFRTVSSALRRKPELNFMQRHHFPTLTLARGPVGSHVQVIYPTSPTTCRVINRVFQCYGDDQRPLQRLLGSMIAPVTKELTRRIMIEDLHVCNDIQRGLMASPFRGVIGSREERIHAFQSFVVERCRAERHLEVVPNVSSS